MITKSFAMKLIQEQYVYLSNEFGVEKIGIFGSVAKQIETKHSNIDIVVTFRKPIGFKFIELVEYLEQLLGTKVDVLTQEGIKNIRIQEISDDIKNNIIYV